MDIDINKLTLELQGILQRRAPVRTNPPSGPSGASPYPGNLKLNGINSQFISQSQSRVVVGGPAAPYGPYTDTTSYSKFWITNGVNEFVNLITLLYNGKVTKYSIYYPSFKTEHRFRLKHYVSNYGIVQLNKL